METILEVFRDPSFPLRRTALPPLSANWVEIDKKLLDQHCVHEA